MWILYASLSAVFAGLVTIFAKAGVQTLNSTLATTLRTIIMAVVLILLTLGLSKTQHTLNVSQLSSKEVLFLILSGISGAISLLLYFAALKAGDAGKVAVIDRMSLVFIAIFSVLFFKEVLHLRALIGIGLVVVGAVLVSWK